MNTKIKTVLTITSMICAISLQAHASYPIKFKCEGVSTENNSKKIELIVSGFVSSNPGSKNIPFSANLAIKGNSENFGTFSSTTLTAKGTKTLMNSSSMYVLPGVQLSKNLIVSTTILEDLTGSLTIIDPRVQVAEDFELDCR